MTKKKFLPMIVVMVVLSFVVMAGFTNAFNPVVKTIQDHFQPATIGSIATLKVGDTVKFMSKNYRVEVKLLDVDITSNRAHMIYEKYNRPGELIESREVSYGPQDIGWEIEVFKLVPERAVIAVPVQR